MYATSETRHVVDINLGLLASLGIPAGRPVFPIAIPDSAAARQVFEQTNGRYALLNPGAAWPNKRWPPESTCRAGPRPSRPAASASSDLVGPRGAAAGGSRRLAVGGAAILSPHTTIADIVALARQAAVMVSGDTGPTHIASAVGTPLGRDLRSDQTRAEWTVAARRSGGVTRHGVRMPSSPPVPARADVPARHRRRGGAGGGGTAAVLCPEGSQCVASLRSWREGGPGAPKRPSGTVSFNFTSLLARRRIPSGSSPARW